MEIEKDLQYYRKIRQEIISHERSFDKDTLPRVERVIQALEKQLINTRAADENPPSLTLILPARVGDFIVVKDGDSTETLRIDGFELRGDELTVWGEGENERYVDFAQHEIIRYIPRGGY